MVFRLNNPIVIRLEEVGLMEAETGYRPMVIFDVPEVHGLIRRTIRACYRGVYSNGAVAFFERYHDVVNLESELQDGHCMVACREGSIIGVGALMGGVIKSVFVEPTMQGRGIGHRLMELLHDEARRKGLLEVRLDSSLVAHRFYLGMGYATVNEASLDLGDGDSLPYFEMVLEL